MPTTLEVVATAAVTAIIGGAFTAVTVAIRSLQWQLRECGAWAEAAEKRADEYARMTMDLVSQHASASRHSRSS